MSFPHALGGNPEALPAVNLDARQKHSGMTAEQLRLADTKSNGRGAVTEGLRIWTGRPYFREHPEVAIRLLSRLKDDDSEYVRKSVGNALHDISRKHRELVRAELRRWDVSQKNVEQTYKLASKFL